MIIKDKGVYCLVLFLSSVILLSGCMKTGIDEEYALERTTIKGQGVIEVETESSKKVELKAVPEDNWEFVKWSGSLEGSKNPQTVILEEGMRVVAQFNYVGSGIEGEGTKEEPFVIYTFSGLERVGTKGYPLDAYYKLGKNIDAAPTKNDSYNNGKGWKPIGKAYNKISENHETFHGVFDGQGYEIKNLYINRKNESGIGLFNAVESGIIKNLNLTDVDIEGDAYVGGLAGINYRRIKNCSIRGDIKGKGRIIGGLTGGSAGIIEDCHATINVEGNETVGGLAGVNRGSIERSYVKGSIKGNVEVGGLLGHNWGRIEDVYAAGKVEGKGEVGGLVGYNTLLIKNSYFKGDIKGRNYVGGLVGHNFAQVKNSYWNTDSLLSSDGGLGISDSQLKQEATFEGWDFDQIWTMDKEVGSPRFQSINRRRKESNYVGPDIKGKGTKEDPFIIYTFSGLEKVGTEGYPPDAYYKLGRDIDASPTGDKNYNNGKGWEPIGGVEDLEANNYYSFAGHFNGNYYEIKNLYINRDQSNYVGLFGLVEGGYIKNLNLTGAEIKGKKIVGGIAGFNGGVIESIYGTGIIKGDEFVGGLSGVNGGKIDFSNFKGTVKGNLDIGGLTGKNSFKVNASHAFGTVEGQSKVGGLAGSNDRKIAYSHAVNSVKGEKRTAGLAAINSGVIESCYRRGDTKGKRHVGGLVFYNKGEIKESYVDKGTVEGTEYVGGLVSFNKKKVVQSWAKIRVKGTNYVGGLVGVNTGLTKNSYAGGDSRGDKFVGGLVGYNYKQGNVNYCYAAGNVEGKQDVGGLIGKKSKQAKANNSYWDLKMADQSAGGTGRTTEKMKQKESFKGWDFTDIWSIEEGKNYPYLQ